MRSETILWQEAIRRAALDLLIGCAQDALVRVKCEDWMGCEAPTADFVETCLLADLDPQRTHEWFLALRRLNATERRAAAADLRGGRAPAVAA